MQLMLAVLTFLLLARALSVALPVMLALAVQENNPARRKRKRDRNEAPKYLILDKIGERLAFIERITQEANREYFNNFRMSNTVFLQLCRVLHADCGLTDDQYIFVCEKVAIFLKMLAHHKKNRVLQTDFQRSGQTISQTFHQVPRVVLKLRDRSLVHPIPIDETTTDKRWKCFQGCVGALDGTYVPLHVQAADQPRYRTRKGHLATNVLGVCDTQGRFVYMLVGWESSAADGRVLCDALTRKNDLLVQNGTHYWCDSGYTNGQSLLTPYKQTRYHLQEWGTTNRRPKNYKEIFNLRHATARNVIERAISILKKRFGVLRSPTFFLLFTQCDIIPTCGLLHNFIISVTPLEPLLDPGASTETGSNEANLEDADDHIQSVNPSLDWTEFRDKLATQMWTDFRARH